MQHYSSETYSKHIAKFLPSKLMVESYRASPGPCTSMKIAVDSKYINNIKKKSNKTLGIFVLFPVELTEIKQDKVR